MTEGETVPFRASIPAPGKANSYSAKYAQLAELFGERLVDEETFRAWDGQSDPEPASGYLFVEIDAYRHRAPVYVPIPASPSGTAIS